MILVNDNPKKKEFEFNMCYPCIWYNVFRTFGTRYYWVTGDLLVNNFKGYTYFQKYFNVQNEFVKNRNNLLLKPYTNTWIF